MCLTADALILFLSFLSPDKVDLSTDTIVIRAQTRDAIWTRDLSHADRWCTDAKAQDAALRLRPAI